MSDILNIAPDAPIWNSCGFDAVLTAQTVFKTLLSFLRTRQEIDFLQNGKSIIVNLSLNNDEEIRRLNREFRNLDRPTNVLSFANIDDDDFDKYLCISPEIELGDIIIAYETLCKEAAEKKISVHDHFAHLLTHGLLHLCGFDHQQDEEAEYMENLETEILQSLNINNPYQE